MRFKKYSRLINYFFILITSFIPIICKATPTQTPADFVKSFYARLDTIDNYHTNYTPLKDFFDPILYQQLLQENKNQKASQGDICGYLDFDPFFHANSDVGPIRSFKALQIQPTTLVLVTFSGKDISTTHLTVQLREENKQWKIVNFLYPSVKATLTVNDNLVNFLYPPVKVTRTVNDNLVHFLLRTQNIRLGIAHYYLYPAIPADNLMNLLVTVHKESCK